MSFADQFEHVIVNDRLEDAIACMADLFAAHLNATFV
jgi:hypothetical protein